MGMGMRRCLLDRVRTGWAMLGSRHRLAVFALYG